ncbi:hypothetical protein AV530_001744 [Patagioenas fasciata monilis]|uniref:Uncharacterized protein n=1 Tax=Patagioenas fasciata monilis TaxID=372326 RepID=A0A1V4KP16_PATFA|nr:hypothetical protein AV530_001744 [Patagioenas fasciata monilis]
MTTALYYRRKIAFPVVVLAGVISCEVTSHCMQNENPWSPTRMSVKHCSVLLFHQTIQLVLLAQCLAKVGWNFTVAVDRGRFPEVLQTFLLVLLCILNIEVGLETPICEKQMK